MLVEAASQAWGRTEGGYVVRAHFSCQDAKDANPLIRSLAASRRKALVRGPDGSLSGTSIARLA